MAPVILEHYDPILSVRETQEAIEFIRDLFQRGFGRRMNLECVFAPLFVTEKSGLKNNLNGVERPVNSDPLSLPGENIEAVQSFAEWRRLVLKHYGFKPGKGLYTDMNATRRDEKPDNLHSYYVDQRGQEHVIYEEDRSIKMLKDTVQRILTIIKHMQHEVWYEYPDACCHLPWEITFINAEELLKCYPTPIPKGRENAVAHECSAVFVERINDALSSDEPHDLRAPDYDDWNLNGGILFWFEPLQCALELSSMGIRISPESSDARLELTHYENRRILPYRKALLNGELPYIIDGGIGQNRLYILLFGRVHIGEIQMSIWPEEMIDTCTAHNVTLL